MFGRFATTLGILTALLFVVGSVIGPRAVAAPAHAPLELQFYGGWTGPDGDVMRNMVSQYNATHSSVHVTLTTLQWSPLFSKFLTQVRAGSPPDVMAMHWQDVAQFASLGVLDPNIVRQAKLKSSDFSSTAWKGTFYKGKQYALPLDQHMHGLFYNKTLFSKAHIKSPPANGKEWVADAIKLTVDSNGKHPNQKGFNPNSIKTYGLGFLFNHHAFYQWYALLYQQGGTFMDKSGKRADFNMTYGANAWRFLENFVFKYHVVPTAESSPINDFVAQRVAMIIDGPWELPLLEKTHIAWATAPYPQVFKRRAEWGSGHILTIPKQSNAAREKAGLSFAKWIIDHSAQWSTSGNVPVLKKVLYPTRTYPGRTAFIDMMPTEVALPDIPKGAQVFSAVAPSPILTAAQAALLRDEDPHSIDSTLKSQVDSITSTP
jgi:multiple sugar transport system substrate-binding protein